ncbi:MAG TPA: ATP-binding protein [Candidatus Acidoferrales bacterium]|nr:ATP-binding protein [Candidatus Acidoferrales bacterium]
MADAVLLTGFINQAIAQTRTLARSLYRVELEANGLMAALDELARNTSKMRKISCDFHCEEPILVHDHSVATHLYRIAQGGIDNAIKHDKASAISVVLSRFDGKTVLSIRDNGTGMTEAPGDRKGMGLHIMRYRAQALGASFTIGPGESSLRPTEAAPW